MSTTLSYEYVSLTHPTRYRKAFAPDVADTLRQALETLKPFMPFHQAVTLRKGLNGEEGQLQAFGLADLFGDGGELGYINIAELIEHPRIELDWHWKPITLAQLRERRGL